MDVVAPVEEIPARFVARTLYEEEFVIAMRAGHPFADDPTLDGFAGCNIWSFRSPATPTASWTMFSLKRDACAGSH